MGTSMYNYILKYKRDDFIVTDDMELIFDNGDFYYYSLRKCGISTSQCLKEIAEEANISLSMIGYAGLKDEDGITEQYISTYQIKLNTIKSNIGEDNWFILNFIGQGSVPIRIGKLRGNHFDITIRNVSDVICKKIYNNCLDYCFINYYDSQRFRLAEKKKFAHKVGDALLQGDYDIALNLLFQGGNITEHEYLSSKMNSSEFWENNDPRFFTFFLNAFDAYKWNTQINTMMANLLTDYQIYYNDDFSYIFPIKNCSIDFHSTSNMMRHRFNGRMIEENLVKREVIIKTKITPYRYFYDTLLNNNCISINFFLPSGCYATMLVRQLMHHFALEN